MKYLILLLVLSVSTSALAAKKKSRSASKSMNSLGADDEILKKVRSYKSKHKVRVVQKRAVDRDLRFELGVNYGAYSGGSPYTNTTGLGGQLEFHINPKWSLGLRHTSYDNGLNAEGTEVFERNRQLLASGSISESSLPSVDRPLESSYAVVSWYPLYGKLNFFDSKIAQFDVYALAGGGQVKLDSGTSQSIIYGGGLGFWLTNHFSTRLEVNYQKFQEQLETDPRDQDMLTVMLSIGFLI